MCLSLQLSFLPPCEVLQFWVPATPPPGFPPGRVGKNLPANRGDARNSGLIPELGRSPGGGHGKPLQHSCLENPVDRGAWGAIARGATKSWTRACTGTPPPPVPTPAVYQCNLARPKLLATPRWSVGQGYARDLHGLGQ